MITRERIVIQETCLDVSTEERYLGTVQDAAAEARAIISTKISESPGFGESLEPIPPDMDDDPLVIHMCQASVSANVGPMASVAGAVDAYIAERLLGMGCRYAVLDNGGDIAMISDRPVRIGLFTGNPETSGLVMTMEPFDGIMSICSSSKRVGHSLSFGESDICSVISQDPILADACATRLGNLVKLPTDIGPALELVCSIPGVIGCLASVGGTIGQCGDVPGLSSLD